MDRIDVAGPVKGLHVAVAALVISVVLFGLTVGVGLYVLRGRNAEQTQFAEALRTGLVEACTENGNPLRVAVQGVLREQIRQSKAVDLSRFFPQVPPSELQRLIAEENARRRARIRKLAPVRCETLYPNP